MMDEDPVTKETKRRFKDDYPEAEKDCNKIHDLCIMMGIKKINRLKLNPKNSDVDTAFKNLNKHLENTKKNVFAFIYCTGHAGIYEEKFVAYLNDSR